MSDMDFPTPDVDVESITPAELFASIEAGEDVTILDVRAGNEFDEWHIEGPNVEIVNVPYFDLLEGVDETDLETIPEGDPLIVLCAKGGSSEFIAGLAT